MPSFPDTKVGLQIMGRQELSRVQFAAVAAGFAVLGLSIIWSTMLSFWGLWTTDALKSIGMVIPLVSLVLVLRAWRSLRWQAEGTWWGLVILLAIMAVIRIQQRAVLIMVISPQWSTLLPPLSLMLLAYGSGVVLLLGGGRLYRAALFPILLLWFANPVPHIFGPLVDSPLQRASAHIARAFAMDLGQTLTPDHLRLMFTPTFGMFIAPGCDGIRGAVTMGFIALIAGYVYRFRWFANALVVIGAILLGYIFNLLRLCLLVVYYVVALHFPSLQNKGENADYVIGGTLFLLATLLLFAVINRLRDARLPDVQEGTNAASGGGFQSRIPQMSYARLAAMGVVVLFGWAGLAETLVVARSSSVATAGATARPFPQHLGNYLLVRSWNETQLAGPVVYVWGEYEPAGGGTPIALGISPVLGWHDPLICHAIRGEHPLWEGPLTVATSDAAPITFSSAFYSDGTARYVEASTQCNGTSCSEFATERTHFGFIFSRLDPKSVFVQNPQRPIPVLLRVETIDMAMPANVARQQLTQSLRLFLASVRLGELTQLYGR